jgi:urocanate hydratase
MHMPMNNLDPDVASRREDLVVYGVVADETAGAPPTVSSACSPPPPGRGVIRHADAGYAEVLAAARRHGLNRPGVTT